jgi:hypothetical protein
MILFIFYFFSNVNSCIILDSTYNLKYLRTQDDTVVYYIVLHSYPRFNEERLLSDFYNSSSSRPVSITTITSMPSKAEPEFLIGAAPVQSMVMSNSNKYSLPQ